MAKFVFKYGNGTTEEVEMSDCETPEQALNVRCGSSVGDTICVRADAVEEKPKGIVGRLMGTFSRPVEKSDAE